MSKVRSFRSKKPSKTGMGDGPSVSFSNTVITSSIPSNDMGDDDEAADDQMGDDFTSALTAKVTELANGPNALRKVTELMSDTVALANLKEAKLKEDKSHQKEKQIKPKVPTQEVKRPEQVSRKVTGLNKDGEFIEKVRSKKERLKLKKEALLKHLEETVKPPSLGPEKKAKQTTTQQSNIFAAQNAFGSMTKEFSSALDDITASKTHQQSAKPFKNTKQHKKALQQDQARFQTVIQHCGSIDAIKNIVQMQMDFSEDNKQKKGKKGKK